MIELVIILAGHIWQFILYHNETIKLFTFIFHWFDLHFYMHKTLLMQ